MKVSRATLTNYNINPDCWFSTNTDRDLFFIANPSRLIAGIYCAVGGDPDSQDYSTLDWELQLYNGNSWILTDTNSNFTLTITNDGLKAITNARAGEIRLKISRIKMIAESLLDSDLPLIYYTDHEFMGYDKAVQNTLVIDWINDGTSEGDFAKHLQYRSNLSNAGLQYIITLLPDDLSVSGITNFNVGSIGLYTESLDTTTDTTVDVLFGIASLSIPVTKIGTSPDGALGSSLKFYLNAVLDNLGYVSNVTIQQQNVSPVPEVPTNTDLTAFGGLMDPYNLYVVADLFNTGVPAVALKKGDATNLSWVYCTPSDHIISDLSSADFTDACKNYMAVTYDDSLHKYIPAEGTKEKAAMGIRLNNTVVTSGTIKNLSQSGQTFYNYQITIVNAGANYSVGDMVRIIYTGSTGASKTLRAQVTAIENTHDVAGQITALQWETDVGSDPINLEETQLYWMSGEGTIPGSGATVRVVSSGKQAIPWNLTPNTPYYVSRTNPGYPTTDITDSFLGWSTSSDTLQLGLDLDVRATTTTYGTTRYATNAEVRNIVSNNTAKSVTTLTPETAKNNYLQTSLPNGSTALPLANAGESANNPVIVDTYTKFTKPIVSTVENAVAFQGTAYRAQWADLAEYYRSDHKYNAGTLIEFGKGDAEITVAIEECNGIISSKPGFILGDNSSELDLPVALAGRVPVAFDGKTDLHFGDKVYLSKECAGKASNIPNGKCLGKIIEKDIEDKTLVTCVVKIDF